MKRRPVSEYSSIRLYYLPRAVQLSPHHAPRLQCTYRNLLVPSSYFRSRRETFVFVYAQLFVQALDLPSHHFDRYQRDDQERRQGYANRHCDIAHFSLGERECIRIICARRSGRCGRRRARIGACDGRGHFELSSCWQDFRLC